MNASNVEQWATEQVRGESRLLFWMNLQQIECAFYLSALFHSVQSVHTNFNIIHKLKHI